MNERCALVFPISPQSIILQVRPKPTIVLHFQSWSFPGQHARSSQFRSWKRTGGRGIRIGGRMVIDPAHYFDLPTLLPHTTTRRISRDFVAHDCRPRPRGFVRSQHHGLSNHQMRPRLIPTGPPPLAWANSETRSWRLLRALHCTAHLREDGPAHPTWPMGFSFERGSDVNDACRRLVHPIFMI